MQSVLDTCKPRPEIISGSFNPEIFTASLGPIIEYYRDGKGIIDSIYTNAELFFREATYPTQGMRLALAEVFGRIAGDFSVPAIHRLETAFGGGKTHTLIACTHIAFKGKELCDFTGDIIDPQILPEPGSVSVVGIAGDEIPVHKPSGQALVPYTLWGEIAYQVGGERLYREVESEVSSHAAPGKVYFDTVFTGRKVLIMLDELAQYAARLDAARPDGASQLAAFLMSLHGYARNHSGIAIILTLASATDAFSRQTEKLAELVSQVRGEEISKEEARGLGEKAVKDVASVVARDAVQITPVQAAEISSVLAKRIFVSIDRDAARTAAGAYMDMYRRNSGMLPQEASSENFRDRMAATYPFHPTLVDFLNIKLAEAENFQGTRGVLRVLALVVNSLWQNQHFVPMIQTCHIDMRSERVVNEILGRTGSSDLLLVLNADVGGVDTGTLEGGQSNAEIADKQNPHPEGFPLYEYTWKTVFLHSLVGREEGMESKIFGLTESEALFSISFPGLTPPQVAIALGEIEKSAFYLRYEQGRYFAYEEPTINAILVKIRKTLGAEQINELLDVTASKIITGGNTTSSLFHIEHNVSLPEDLPDGKGKPVLGVVSLSAEPIDIEAMITTRGFNKPREQQNLIFVLVPDTVPVKGAGEMEGLFENTTRAWEARQRIETFARQVKAMSILASKPQNYGVNPRRLEEEDFKKRKAKHELELSTAVSGIYTSIYYPSTAGSIVRKEIRTAGGEGGATFINLIQDILIKDGELITAANKTKSDLTSLGSLFFEHGDTIALEDLRKNFCNLRNWPVLENPDVLETIVRAGVQKETWCVFRMGAEDTIKPAEFYHRDNDIPIGVNLAAGGYMLVTLPGAKQRDWTETRTIDPARLREDLYYIIAKSGAATLQTIMETYAEKYGEVSGQDLEEALVELVRSEKVYSYQGSPDQPDRPELIHGPGAAIYKPHTGDVFITPAKASQRGWITSCNRSLNLTGREGAEKILPLLRRLGSIYNRGAKSTIENMDLVELELSHGGTLSLRLTGVTPESMKTLGEIFEVLDGIVEKGAHTEAYLDIMDPRDDCLFIKALKDK